METDVETSMFFEVHFIMENKWKMTWKPPCSLEVTLYWKEDKNDMETTLNRTPYTINTLIP